jgi:hypothetical protein
MSQSAAFLKKLRKKYGLGEFSRKGSVKKRTKRTKKRATMAYKRRLKGKRSVRTVAQQRAILRPGIPNFVTFS